MLWAYAAENLCKSVIVQRMPDAEGVAIMETGRLPRVLLSHNLVDLLNKKIGFALDKRDKSLARRLARTATWSARYPVPRDVGEVLHHVDGHPSDSWGVLTSADEHDVNHLLGRLEHFASAVVHGSS